MLNAQETTSATTPPVPEKKADWYSWGKGAVLYALLAMDIMLATPSVEWRMKPLADRSQQDDEQQRKISYFRQGLKFDQFKEIREMPMKSLLKLGQGMQTSQMA